MAGLQGRLGARVAFPCSPAVEFDHSLTCCTMATQVLHSIFDTLPAVTAFSAIQLTQGFNKSLIMDVGCRNGDVPRSVNMGALTLSGAIAAIHYRHCTSSLASMYSIHSINSVWTCFTFMLYKFQCWKDQQCLFFFFLSTSVYFTAITSITSPA